MTTSDWLPVITTAAGSITTLAGAGLTHLLSRGRFSFETAQRQREVERNAVAEALMRGLDYTNSVHDVVSTMAATPPVTYGSNEWLAMAESVMPKINATYPLREPAMFAILKAQLALTDTTVEAQLKVFGDAFAGVQRALSHATKAIAVQEEYDSTWAESQLTAYFERQRWPGVRSTFTSPAGAISETATPSLDSQ